MKDVKVEDIAKDVNKITDEELKSVQGKVNVINQAQMTVGGLEVQKASAMEQLKAAQQELQIIQKDLEEKYGKVSVNLTDGTISEIPEDETDKKD
jgi:secreted trypsin-like serine protease|tara:strand:+ start:445 stop:729 length:285 start_codon:yes stop_codon:yes gene_type:complete